MTSCIANLTKALAAFQGEVTNPLNSANNPYFNSKYAPLSAILTLVRPILAKHGLSIMQNVGGNLQEVNITTILAHESGEWIQFDPLILPGEQSLKGGGKALTVQGAGSAISYARRYSICSVLNITGEDDDDGNGATKHTQPQPPQSSASKQTKTKPMPTNAPTSKPPTKEGVISSEQLKLLWVKSREKGLNDQTTHNWMKHEYKVESSKDLNKSQLEGMLQDIESGRIKLWETSNDTSEEMENLLKSIDLS
jgi:hypothetical protein